MKFVFTFLLLWPVAADGLAFSALKCSSPVIVAVIDTGVDFTHTSLQHLPWLNNDPKNGRDDDNNGFVDDTNGWDFVFDRSAPADHHGHGTHITGIILQNFRSPSASRCLQIMSLKYYDNSGAGFNNLSNTVRAIQYAVKNGAHIINYSGGGADPAAVEKAAVEAALKKEIIFVAAAGNDGNDSKKIPYYPANYFPEIVSVASTGSNGHLLSSSNYGSLVFTAAPGLNVKSTLPSNKTGNMSGTSQATAYVTGLVASILAYEPGAAPARIRELLSHGEPLTGKRSTKHGRASWEKIRKLLKR